MWGSHVPVPRKITHTLLSVCILPVFQNNSLKIKSEGVFILLHVLRYTVG